MKKERTWNSISVPDVMVAYLKTEITSIHVLCVDTKTTLNTKHRNEQKEKKINGQIRGKEKGKYSWGN